MDAPALDPLAPTVPPGENELPYDDGEPVESTIHLKQMNVLIQTLRWHFRDRTDVFIAGNLGVYYSELQVRKNDFKAPDFMVVLGVDPRDRKSWVVWGEDGRTPDVVIEILSESTASTDRGSKLRVYERALKVAEYYLFDPATGDVEGYRLGSEALRYAPIEPEEGGDFECRQLGLRLGVVSGVWEGSESRWFRWKDAHGNVLPTEAESERGRADAERGRADAERGRADALAARLRAAGLDPEG